MVNASKVFIYKEFGFKILKRGCLLLASLCMRLLTLSVLMFCLISYRSAFASSVSVCGSIWSLETTLTESHFKRKVFNHFIPRTLKRYFVSKMYLSSHSQLRMHERSITENEILEVLDVGQIIFYKELNGDYNTHETKLAVVNGRPLHVVYNLDAVSHYSPSADRILTVVTVYEVDDIHWEKDLRTPKSKFND